MNYSLHSLEVIPSFDSLGLADNIIKGVRATQPALCLLRSMRKKSVRRVVRNWINELDLGNQIALQSETKRCEAAESAERSPRRTTSNEKWANFRIWNARADRSRRVVNEKRYYHVSCEDFFLRARIFRCENSGCSRARQLRGRRDVMDRSTRTASRGRRQSSSVRCSRSSRVGTSS